jgi:hypothetical protein
MGFLTDLFSGGASNLVNSVGNVLDKVVTTKGEKMQLDNEIKKAEMQFQTDMAKLSVEEKQMIYTDIASARSMATAIETSPTAPKLAKITAPMLAIGTTVLTFGLFYILLFRNKQLVDAGSKDLVLYILGVLSAIVTQIFSFYFGSSQGSADKNKMLTDMYNKADTNKNL